MRSLAEVRHERLLWGEPLSQPVPVETVIAVEHPLFEQEAVDDFAARRDDAFWAAYMRLPFTWQRFTNWWVARRWVRPRDIRKE